MSLYLDTSILVPLFVLEARSVAVTHWAATVDRRLFVGRLSVIELGSAISRKRRVGELDELQGREALAAFDDWLDALATRVDHDAQDFVDAAVLVRCPTPKLLPADAVHLVTARRLGLTLATDDGGLQEVATFNGINWLSPA